MIGDNSITAFAYIGILTVAIVGIMAGIFVISHLCDLLGKVIKKLKYKNRIKNRFAGTPTAKCYCIDCKYHSLNGKCDIFYNHNTNNDFFCSFAQPNDIDYFVTEDLSNGL